MLSFGPYRSLFWEGSRSMREVGEADQEGYGDACAYGSPWRRRMRWRSAGGGPALDLQHCPGHVHRRWPHFSLPLAGRIPTEMVRAASQQIDDWWGREYGPGTGREERLLEDDVPPIPARFVEGQWLWCWQHLWRRQEHINLQEGRALVRAAERTCQSPSRLWQQHLILTDSQVMLGVAQKGRSSVPQLNRFARRLAALSLGYRQCFFYRRVPTKLNPADEPSREFGNKVRGPPISGSKGLARGGVDAGQFPASSRDQ